MAGTGLFTEILDGEAYKYYSDGEWKKSSSGKLVPIINPTTRKVHYKVQGDYFFSFCFNHVYDFSCFGSFLQSELQVPFIWLIGSACTQEEVNKVMESAKIAQKLWAKTPLWKRAELLHKAASILKEHKAPIAECLVKEIAKPAKDAVTEVSIRITFIF